MRTAIVAAALIAATTGAMADVSGAYAFTRNNGNADAYIIVTQKGQTLLVTFNILGLTAAAPLGGTTKSNVFSYGVGTLDPVTQTSRVQMSNFGAGCYSILDLRFNGTQLTKTGVGGTCVPSTSAAESFAMIY